MFSFTSGNFASQRFWKILKNINFYIFSDVILSYNPLILCRIDSCMDARIYIVGIAIGLVLSGGTTVFAQSNTTGNNTDVGTAEELTQLTSNNSLANLSSMTTFNDTGATTFNDTQTNQTSNQTSNMSG